MSGSGLSFLVVVGALAVVVIVVLAAFLPQVVKVLETLGGVFGG